MANFFRLTFLLRWTSFTIILRSKYYYDLHFTKEETKKYIRLNRLVQVGFKTAGRSDTRVQTNNYLTD